LTVLVSFSVPAWKIAGAHPLKTEEKNKMSATNKEIVEKVNAAFAENNMDGWLSFCADDVTWTIVGERAVKGKEAIRNWMASMDMEPPTFTVENIIAEGDLVTAHGGMTMKDKEGKAVPYAYCDLYRFQNGKIVDLKSFVVKTETKAKTASGA
jgi:ketosteroid isomerase-like protein